MQFQLPSSQRQMKNLFISAFFASRAKRAVKNNKNTSSRFGKLSSIELFYKPLPGSIFAVWFHIPSLNG